MTVLRALPPAGRMDGPVALHRSTGADAVAAHHAELREDVVHLPGTASAGVVRGGASTVGTYVHRIPIADSIAIRSAVRVAARLR